MIARGIYAREGTACTGDSLGFGFGFWCSVHLTDRRCTQGQISIHTYRPEEPLAYPQGSEPGRALASWKQELKQSLELRSTLACF